MEILQSLFGRELLKRRHGEGGVLPVVILGRTAGMGEVAAAVAGGKQLASDALLALKDNDAAALILRGGKRGDEPGGPAADNDHSFHIFILRAGCHARRGYRTGG